MKTSESIKNLADALCKAQAKLEGADKDAKNTFHNSKYANLEAVINASKIIHDFGLSFIQGGGQFGPDHILTTRLMHTSGEWIEGTYPIKSKDDSDPQKVKSAHTYARRASIMAILGMSETDDDGNAGSGKGDKPKEPVKPSNSPTTPIKGPQAIVGANTKVNTTSAQTSHNLTPAQINRLEAKGKAAGIPANKIVETVRARFNCMPSEMRVIDYQSLCDELDKAVMPQPTGGASK